MDQFEKQAIREELKALQSVSHAVMVSVGELKEPGALQRWVCHRHSMAHKQWWMSSSEVLEKARAGERACPQCARLAEKSEPVSLAEFKKAVEKQQKLLDKIATKASSKARRRGWSHNSTDRYAV